MPLGHYVSAIRGDGSVIGGMTSAKDPHFVLGPAVRTYVLDKVLSHGVLEASSSTKQQFK
jgi:hypothetical protein